MINFWPVIDTLHVCSDVAECKISCPHSAGATHIATITNRLDYPYSLVLFRWHGIFVYS